ncbi:MAG: chemotaxis-specific protein-glutamate methyltransferase CheB [Thermoanaerobaculia bacterium]|nr:chemotaxis-specific protein-glutamate methyltransferase CheB [Thermoanaerobaculia bacterium]
MIKALVIDDSAFNRVTISRMLESSREIEVVGTAANGEEGIKETIRFEPDLITLDLEMPVMDGFSFLRWLMANRPTPVIVVSSKATDRSVFKALELGAIEFIAKPGGAVSPRLAEIQNDLVRKALEVASASLEKIKKRSEQLPPRLVEKAAAGPLTVDLVVIGSSTGGPPALQQIFQTLPLMEVPIVVAQHMPGTFTKLFAERLTRLSQYRVKEANDGERIVPRVVYISPGGMQTTVTRDGEGLMIRVRDRKSSDLYAPSVNQLFRSAADVCGPRLLGVILTGMGDDGAEALMKMRTRGGRTIAESESTAIVFGMPKAAIGAGAAEEVLPLQDIPSAMRRICIEE